ncbi:MAG: decaprenyl-phosphate phosphoribosyltransferase [Chloroflexi bacterium]|nr:decaprenyl-phosphate phosphoribosyltransferase [Chloroflexota bacterium]
MTTAPSSQGEIQTDAVQTKSSLGFTLRELWRAMRPRQWSKNLIVFAALVFDVKFMQPQPLMRTVGAFVIFCLVSSSVYLLNDLVDIEKDRAHPTKRNRPLASGALSPWVAIAAMIGLLLMALSAAFALDWTLAAVTLLYFLTNVAYSFYLKHVVIVDAMIVAMGFVLRVLAGAIVVQVERFSPWLYVCVTFIALVIALGKRRAEITSLDKEAGNHRAILDEYTVPLLDQLIGIMTAATIVAYSLYTFSAENLPKNDLMMLTIPFVVYFLFRYIYLVRVKELGGSPDELLFKDKHLFFTAIAWGLSSVAILYFTHF